MTAEQKAMIHEHFEELGMECLKDNVITEQDIDDLRAKNVPTGEKVPCFLACVMKKVGVVSMKIKNHIFLSLDLIKKNYL